MANDLDAIELDRFWNELVRGRRPADLNLPPELAATVRAFHSLAAAPLPAGLGSRTDCAVEVAMASPAHDRAFGMATHMNGFAHASIDRALVPFFGSGRTPLQSAPARRRFFQSPTRFRLIAALALLAGLFGSGSGLFWNQNERAAFIPAAFGSPTIAAPNGTTVETLAEVTLPASALPVNGEVYFVKTNYETEGTTPFATDAGSTTAISIVTRGTLTIQTNNHFYVIRKPGDSWTQVAPGKAATILAGGAALFPGLGNARRIERSVVAGTVVFTGSLIGLAAPADGPQLSPAAIMDNEILGELNLRVNVFGAADWDRLLAAAGGQPITISMRRVTLAPGARIDEAASAPTLRYVNGGMIEWEPMGADGSALPGAQAIYGGGGTSGVPFQWPVSGERDVISNPASAPAIVYELSIGPALPGTPTLSGTPTA